MPWLIRKGDLVQMITGNDAGRRTRPAEGDSARPAGTRGRVKYVDAKKGVIEVEGINVARKAVRPDPRKGIRGGFIDKNLPVRMSNVMLVCPKCDKPVKPRRQLKDGKKIRTCRKCGEEI